MTDAEVLLQPLFVHGLNGDVDAYQDFLKRLAAHLRAFLRRRLYGWPDDVEDLVQECLLAVHNQRQTYEADQPLTAWVQAIARYKVIDLLRVRARTSQLHDPWDDARDLFLHSDDLAGQARHDLMVMLKTLPDRQRLPIVHVKLEGLSVVQTARLTGMSESAVKVGIHRGLRALSARFANAHA